VTENTGHRGIWRQRAEVLHSALVKLQAAYEECFNSDSYSGPEWERLDGCKLRVAELGLLPITQVENYGKEPNEKD